MSVPTQRLLSAILERRSLRSFQEAFPRDDELALLFEAARWAPSSGNGQPWRFIITRRGSDPFESLAATLRPGNRWAMRAPLLVLAVARKEHVKAFKPRRPNRLALLELGLSLGNLLTQATTLGISVHPMAGYDAAAAQQALAVPNEYEPGVVLAIGYPGDPADLDPEVRAKDERPRERLDLGEIVFEGSWGEVSAYEVTVGDEGSDGGDDG